MNDENRWKTMFLGEWDRSHEQVQQQDAHREWLQRQQSQRYADMDQREYYSERAQRQEQESFSEQQSRYLYDLSRARREEEIERRRQQQLDRYGQVERSQWRRDRATNEELEQMLELLQR